MKGRTLLTSRSFLSTLALLLALTVGIWIGCGEQTQAPTEVQETQEIVLSPSDPQVQAVIEIQNRYTEELMQRPGIVGTATGMTEDGKPAVLVFVKDDALAKQAALPAELEETPVIMEITGEFKALQSRSDFDPTAKHRPAPNGVSLGHPNITAGTLGCLVTRAGRTFILSNNHVMADENNASRGDNILQPGAFDGGQNPADAIATLTTFKPIDFSGGDNVIDAALARVDPADVTGKTHESSYGAPQSTPIAASVGMRVMKYGRTTQQTRGRVSAINATVNVGYDSGVARFINQIIISPGSFSAGGDSGSLIVVQGGSNARKPVGLLFAGSASVTIANPIDAVLNEFGVTVVGD